jgi:hypothetical protein
MCSSSNNSVQATPDCALLFVVAQLSGAPDRERSVIAPLCPEFLASLSLVKFRAPRLPRGSRRKYPFRAGAAYVFFGEIPNMPGHCVVADYRSGQIHSGYHTDNFVELREEEA